MPGNVWGALAAASTRVVYTSLGTPGNTPLGILRPAGGCDLNWSRLEEKIDDLKSDDFSNGHTPHCVIVLGDGTNELVPELQCKEAFLPHGRNMILYHTPCCWALTHAVRRWLTTPINVCAYVYTLSLFWSLYMLGSHISGVS